MASMFRGSDVKHPTQPNIYAAKSKTKGLCELSLQGQRMISEDGFDVFLDQVECPRPLVFVCMMRRETAVSLCKGILVLQYS